jgi:hypothetical protein
MGFQVQLGHPRIRISRPVSAGLGDALSLLFRPDEESVYLFWQEIPIRIRYREDLPRCFGDILALAWMLQRDAEGAARATFETQLVTMDWAVRWQDEACDIEASFAARDPLFEPYAAALAARSTLRIDRTGLLAEWKTLLRQVVVVFEAGGVEIEDGVERRKWELLQRVERGIPAYGEIYTRPA